VGTSALYNTDGRPAEYRKNDERTSFGGNVSRYEPFNPNKELPNNSMDDEVMFWTVANLTRIKDPNRPGLALTADDVFGVSLWITSTKVDRPGLGPNYTFGAQFEPAKERLPSPTE